MERARDWMGDSPEEAAVAAVEEAELPEGACCAHIQMELELAAAAVDWEGPQALESLPLEGHWGQR